MAGISKYAINERVEKGVLPGGIRMQDRQTIAMQTINEIMKYLYFITQVFVCTLNECCFGRVGNNYKL